MNKTDQILDTYVEMDPSERYGRFKDVLGKGAMKNVYRAFDEFLGMEVAWNQVKLNDIFGSPDELQRLYSEVHLLKTLNHSSIMRSHASWIDIDRRTFNFITEMFTSGSLREYRKRYTRVNIRVIKNWARQILEGLDYLHSHEPPVIHRDLKCDNIFVNGHLGQVKIGDLGLAAILRDSHHAHSVIGTPEFMAPELYDEDYDELVDIYSFGMCVLEMLTCEYPYNECSNPAQIYKKVTSGKLPQAFFKIDDVEARRFVGRCLDRAPNRPSARELLEDPFLSVEEVDEMPAISIPSRKTAQGGITKGLTPQLGSPANRTDMIIKGTMNSEDDTIFLQVQLYDKNGRPRNIYFPFDITSDTALDVAAEMVKELEILDWEPFEIGDMIDNEVSGLVPSWKSPYSPQIHQQHSFTYVDDEDNDDNSLDHPFYPTSSVSSSQASLPGVFTSDGAQLRQGDTHDWLQEDLNMQDDASSDCSSLSPKYSNLMYYSENEDDRLSSTIKDDLHVLKTQKSTRFCPERDPAGDWNHLDCSSKHQQKMVHAKSMMDIRSQLLHKTLVEEISKRRLFNTVGGVEHIGFRHPGDFSGSKTMNGFCPGKSANWNKF